jgi:regulator of sigma E protease
MLEFLLDNDFLSAILAFAIVLIPAVIIHEFGHFLAAKAVGITVLEFGIGFPPRAAKLFTWGETEFTLNWLPLGGFVRPLGEDMIRPLSEEETRREREKLLEKMAQAPSDTDRETTPTTPVYNSEREELAARGITRVRSINEVKPVPRIFFMAAGALANFLSALLIFILIGLIGIPQRSGARVHLLDVDPASPLGQAGFLANDFIETLNGEQFENSRAFFRQLAALDGEEATVTLRRAEVEDEVVITFTPTDEFAQSLAEAQGRLNILENGVQPDSPAFTAGVQPEDVVVAFAGEDLTTAEEPFERLQSLTQEYEGQETTITVLRNGETLSLPITPRNNPPPGVGRLGIGLDPQYISDETGVSYTDGPDQQDYIPLTPRSAVTYGFERTGEILRSIAEFPVRLLRRETQPEENRIVSIVGVSQLGGEFLQESIEQDRPIVILNYIALISIALGVTNLFPIPALDGGRILFVLIEIIRGKPIAPEREGIIHLIGLAFLLSIGIIFILNDIFNPLTDLLP